MKYTREFTEFRFGKCIFKKPILAYGSQQKNTICLAESDSLFISNKTENLALKSGLEEFQKKIEYIQKKLKPQVVAYDMHPGYISTQYALKSRITKKIVVQHHHAHAASCLFDNSGIYNPRKKVIAVSFDGTGFGDDGNLWGGEFLIADFKSYKRVAHIENIKLPGSEKAILEPYRIAFSILYKIYGDSVFRLKLGLLKNKSCRLLKEIIDKDINSPYVSSVGRLFDGVCAILGSCFKIGYQGQAAIKLTELARKISKETLSSKKYKVKIKKDKSGVYLVKYDAIIMEIIKDLKNKVKKEEIAYKFHIWLADSISAVCKKLRKVYDINEVALSGGVFQNEILKDISVRALNEDGFKVFTHNRISCNDSGISVGQVMIANARI